MLGSAQEEGAAANIVDLAGHSLGVIVDATDETVAEDLVLAASDAEVVLDVTGGLLEVERVEMVTELLMRFSLNLIRPWKMLRSCWRT